MSATTYEARGREISTRSFSFLPSADPNRERVEEAVATLQQEIAKLRTLQQRADLARQARTDTDRVVERANRRAQERERDRSRMISIDRKWFWQLAQAYLDGLIGSQADAFEKDLTAIAVRERQLSGGA
jgi:hypothetical protein